MSSNGRRWQPGIDAPDALDASVSLAANRIVNRMRFGTTADVAAVLSIPPFVDEHGTPNPTTLRLLAVRLAYMASQSINGVREGPVGGDGTLIDYQP